MIKKQIQIPFEKLSSSAFYPHRLERIEPKERISPELGYRIIHIETGLRIPGVFTEEEATFIQKITLHWDWKVDKKNKPVCAPQLLHLLEQLCNPSSVIKEIAL